MPPDGPDHPLDTVMVYLSGDADCVIGWTSLQGCNQAFRLHLPHPPLLSNRHHQILNHVVFQSSRQSCEQNSRRNWACPCNSYRCVLLRLSASCEDLLGAQYHSDFLVLIHLHEHWTYILYIQGYSTLTVATMILRNRETIWFELKLTPNTVSIPLQTSVPTISWNGTSSFTTPVHSVISSVFVMLLSVSIPIDNPSQAYRRPWLHVRPLRNAWECTWGHLHSGISTWTCIVKDLINLLSTSFVGLVAYTWDIPAEAPGQ